MATPESKIRFGGWNATDWAAARSRINRLAFIDEVPERTTKRHRGNKECKDRRIGHDLVLIPPTGKPDHITQPKAEYWANLFNEPMFGRRADVYVCARCGKIKTKWSK